MNSWNSSRLNKPEKSVAARKEDKEADDFRANADVVDSKIVVGKRGSSQMVRLIIENRSERVSFIYLFLLLINIHKIKLIYTYTLNSETEHTEIDSFS
jgi:hypothetical protein